MLLDKSILVTGASSGIGYCTVRYCAELGANITLTSRNIDNLEVLRGKLSSSNNHITIAADLSKENDIIHLAEQVTQLDGLVLNAGVVKTMPLRYIKTEEIDTMLNINLKSSIVLINTLLKLKKLKRGSSICIISSISSIKPTPANSVYAASKGALNSFSRAIALELAPRGIRVNAVLPGFIKSEMTQKIADEELLSKHVQNYPLGRFGEPQDVANTIAFLLSDQTSWMTGNLINLDGGFSLK